MTIILSKSKMIKNISNKNYDIIYIFECSFSHIASIFMIIASIFDM